MISAGDPLNGSGTTTGASRSPCAPLPAPLLPTWSADPPPSLARAAWSLVYLFLNGRKALSARRPGPVALAGIVAAQAATYGGYYFGQD